jgi:hypothetical protein
MLCVTGHLPASATEKPPPTMEQTIRVGHQRAVERPMTSEGADTEQ